ncbi:MAG TPA: enoyl-CoA hydratase/isomerase family protein, partial [Steroidobacteraceae bacterium]|nr:enoyl-CoA hydratase/isomerase family protein [Steroidobacteraceae bacterium]
MVQPRLRHPDPPLSRALVPRSDTAATPEHRRAILKRQRELHRSRFTSSLEHHLCCSLPHRFTCSRSLLYEKRNATAYVTLNRPQVMNALNQQAIAELRAAFEDAQDDPQIRGVIITGAGNRAFIAGADINELAKATPIEAERQTRAGQALLDLVEHLGKPVIAAVNGLALGGGCETALACTIRLASPGAKFGQPEIKLGLIPGFGGTQRLPRLVGKGVALQL